MTSATRPGNRVNVREGLCFGRGGDVDLLCDVYEPPEPNGTGVLLLFGGAWQAGERRQLRGYGILLGRLGYTCVCAEYRLAPPRSDALRETDPRLAVGARWPAQLHDIKAAARWMRQNAADLSIDPNRIAAAGVSAGAHLALLLAGTAGRADLEGDSGSPGVSSRVAAAIALYPPTDLRLNPRGGVLLWPGNVEALLGPHPADELVAEASPLQHASTAFPPTLLIHGTSDRKPGDSSPNGSVAHHSSVLMYEALEAVDVPAELHLLAGLPHAFDTDPALARLCVNTMDSFLSRFVNAPPT